MTKKLIIIGLAGRAGAGKDTCADIMCSSHGFVRTNFAAPLRNEIIDAFWIDPHLFSTELKERRTPALAIGRCADADFIKRMVSLDIDPTLPRSPREIMRWWGTEYRRNQDEAYWTRLMKNWIDLAIRHGHHRIAVTDVRFLNESMFLQGLGACIWLIRRGAADARIADHASELQISQLATDHVIDNNGSLAELAKAIESTLQGLTQQTESNIPQRTAGADYER